MLLVTSCTRNRRIVTLSIRPTWSMHFVVLHVGLPPSRTQVQGGKKRQVQKATPSRSHYPGQANASHFFPLHIAKRSSLGDLQIHSALIARHQLQ